MQLKSFPSVTRTKQPVTLVYLTTQVRQNTKSINSNNSNNVMTGFNQINSALISDPEAAHLRVEGFYGIDQFSEIDKTRFTHLINGFFNIFRNLYHQYQAGTISQA